MVGGSVLHTAFGEAFLIVSTLALILFLQGVPAVAPGTVTGQLRTVDGALAVAVRVAAIPVPTVAAVQADGVQYFPVPLAENITGTDTQGRYRLTNLPPGRYYVMAGAIGEATYYPSSTNTDKATVVTVGPGSTTANLDFRLLKRLGGKISGHVKLNTGDPQMKATLLGGKLEEILEASVGKDGGFEFPHVPPGTYLLGLFPRPPGMESSRIAVGDADVTGLELVEPRTHEVTGRIIVAHGPLPHALLEFATHERPTVVGGSINPDWTFSARLNEAHQYVDLAGMPVGYSIASVRIGSEDAARGFVVKDSDIRDLVITVAAPQRLPRVRGSITGLPAARLASTKVEMSGPIIGTLETVAREDGSFEFSAVVPGTYQVKLPEVPELAPITLVVAGWDTTVLKVAVPGR